MFVCISKAISTKILLCFLGKQKMKEDGTHKYNGRFKYICDLHDKPLEEAMDEVKSKIKE